MSQNQPIDLSWAHALKRWGINEIVASILEGAGSLSMLFAQVVYLSQPLLTGVISKQTLMEFAQVLENPTERQRFVSYLREASSSGTVA